MYIRICTHTGAQLESAHDLRASKVRRNSERAIGGRQVPRDNERAEPGGENAEAADVRYLKLDDRQQGTAI